MISASAVIAHTQRWITAVVIGCNFCPFAAKQMLKNTIRYVALSGATMESGLEALAEELRYLAETDEIETTLLIFPDTFADFDEYLALVAAADGVVSSKIWKGVFQIAGFHPEYCFTDAEPDDPANYTNRSPYPMLHILRESSITQAVEHLSDPDSIPERNIAFSQSKGLEYMQALRSSCFDGL